MRICPTCSTELKDYDYHFCTKCLSELPKELVKVPGPHLINVKLDFSLIPNQKFLIFSIPYENRVSFNIMKSLLIVVIITSLVLFIAYNLSYGF
jgi:hypothetical protein